MSGRWIFEASGFLLRALHVFALALPFAQAVHAHYGLAGMLPGDAVDPLTDMSQYSFAVPHAVRGFATSVAPLYRFSSHTDTGFEQNLHTGTLPLFALYQFERARFGILTDNQLTATPQRADSLTTRNRAMFGYLWSNFSFALEGGASYVNQDRRMITTSLEGALAASAYWGRWGFDAVGRLLRPQSVHSRLALLPYSEEMPPSQDMRYENQLYSLRFRGDFSYSWRFVMQASYLRSPQTDFAWVSGLIRYRLGTLQLLSGLQYAYGREPSYSRRLRLNLPIHLILEHGSSVFYLSAASPIFVRAESDTVYSTAWNFRLVPRVAYMYRFGYRWWLALSVSEQSVAIYEYQAPGTREISASLRLTYNIAPFGFDDEVPSGDYLAYGR